ncbi:MULTISPECIES: hypothetical protein [unclassified Streptomyces]|uniref:hypothetical protein n=1 Tax=unclassified Streptomyces TaxID=2593676 RepID=UPI00081D3861|nr:MULTISPECIES: hypothetical protein [unclassified Streptomyces]SCF61067.1 4-amino-4-deoxy-L-arabinose transferase [Streptomyces sp. MnatMP-M17]
MAEISAVASGSQGKESRPWRDRASARELGLLAAVAGVYTLVQLTLFVPGSGLGWDETVYVSQVARDAEAAFFSAPRARGITFLVAPVTLLTSSVGVLRIYLALLSGAGLFCALLVWRRLLPVPVLAVAGALFAGLWISVAYGPQVMPNLWVALGALFAVGCFLRAARDRSDRRALAGLGAGVAFVALMRPSDALWLALPLAAATLLVGAWRRPVLLLTLAAGTVLGCAPWVIEAYTAYGGLLARLRRASEIQGDMGWHLAFGDHLRALDGRLLCRPCDVPWRRPVTAVWWLVLPLLTAGGVLVGFRLRRRAAVLVPTLAGLALAVPYLLLIDYAAPRFLLPAYALLALPVAVCLVRLVGSSRIGGSGRPRLLVVSVLAAALTGHLAIQYAVLDGVAARSRAVRVAFGRVAAELDRQGVRPPCVISGAEAVRIAFRTGCASRQTGGHDASITADGLLAAARERPVAVVVAGKDEPPSYTHGWLLRRLPDLPDGRDCRAYLSPSTGPATGTR